MQVRVQGRPGELEERVEDVVKVIRKLAGNCDHDHDLLSKALDQAPRKLDLAALQGGVDRASLSVQRIKRKMMADMLEVLREAK